MPVAYYRTRVVFQGVQWDGTNEIEIATWMARDGINMTIMDDGTRRLVAIVSWGLLTINVGDYIVRSGHRFFDRASGEDFLKMNEEQQA